MAFKRTHSETVFTDSTDEDEDFFIAPVKQVAATSFNDFVEGRCILTSNVTMKFFRPVHAKGDRPVDDDGNEITKKSQKADGPIEGHNLHIFFQNFESRSVHESFYSDKFQDVLQGRSISGVLYLEFFLKHMCYDTKTQLVGMIIFTCPPNVRDAYLTSGIIPHTSVYCPPATIPDQQNNMLGKDVMIFPASPTAITALPELRNDFCPRPMSDYRNNLSVMITSPELFCGVKSLPTLLETNASCFVNSWTYPSLMDTWCLNHNVRCASDPPDQPKLDNSTFSSRPLQIHEFFYLYFYINLHCSRKTSPDFYNFKNCVRYVRVHAPKTEIESELSEFYAGANFNAHIFKVLNRFARYHPNVIEEALSSYKENCLKHYKSLAIGGEMFALLENKTKTYSSFPLFTSLHINKLRVENIELAPVTTLDVQKIIEWVSARKLVIAERVNDMTVYEEVFSELEPVIAEDMPLRLYAKEGLYTMSYVSQFNKGEFATAVLDPPQSMSKDFVNLKMPYDDQELCVTGMDRGVVYASVHGTPIWQRQKIVKDELGLPKETNDYMIVRETTQGQPIDKIFDCMLKDGLKNHEVVSSEFHISTLVLDIDLNPARPIPDMDVTQLAKDCVSLANTVLSQLKILDGCKHYVFYSDPRTNQTPSFTGEKFGLHHHIRLPDGIVMQQEAASTFVKILSEVRYTYPSTIGIFCGEKDCEVYDQKIYGKPMAVTSGNAAAAMELDECVVGKVTHHPIRLPGMKKRTGTNKLTLIYSSTGETEIPRNYKMVHGPMEADVGRVITKLVGHKPINDEQYIRHLESKRIDRYVNEACTSGGEALINEVNTKSILIGKQGEETYSVLSKQIMAEHIDTLWQSTGSKAMKRHLESLSHPDSGKQYSQKDIMTAIEGSKVIYSVKRDKFLLVSEIRQDEEKFFLCPKRVHTRPHAEGVVVEVFTQSNMVRFGFCIGKETFKRCSGSYIPNVSGGMTYNHVCLFESVAKSVEREIEAYNVPGVDVSSICKTPANALGEDHNTTSMVDSEDKIDYDEYTYSMCEMDLIEYDQPLKEVAPSIDSVQYLYAHYRNKRNQWVTCFRSMTNRFVLLVKDSKGVMNPFCCVNATMFIEALCFEFMADFIGVDEIRAIANVMKNMDGQTVEKVNAKKKTEEDEEEDIKMAASPLSGELESLMECV